MEQNFDAFYFILPIFPSYMYELLLLRVKAARFLGCIYISLQRTHCFDKESVHERERRLREQNTWVYTQA